MSMATDSSGTLASIESIYEDGDHVILTCDGTAHRIHRCTPLGRAYTGLRDASLRQTWGEAMNDAVAKGIDPAAQPEPPQSLGFLGRLFGRKPAAVPPRIPGVPDYRAAAQAVGLPPNLNLAGLSVTEQGAQMRFSDNLTRAVDMKSNAALRIAELLEEMDAVGIEYLPAMEAMSRNTGRPLVRLQKFGPPPVARKVSRQVAQMAPIGEESSMADINNELAAHAVEQGEHLESFTGPQPMENVPTESVQEPEPVTSAPVAPSAHVERADDAETRAPFAPAPVTSVVATQPEGPDVFGIPPGVVERIAAVPDLSDEFAEQQPNSSSTSSADSAAAAHLEHETQQQAAVSPAAVPSQKSEPTPQMGSEPEDIGFSAPAEDAPHWSKSSVRLTQNKRPGPDGPFRLVAKGEQAPGEKASVFGEIEVSKQDYEVIKWLARNRREARFQLEMNGADKEASDQQPAGSVQKATVFGLKLQNNSKQFVDVDWAKCRDEFELANRKVQTPAEREAQKSATVESQIATPALPGMSKTAPAKASEVDPGDLPLPHLRQIPVPRVEPSNCVGPQIHA